MEQFGSGEVPETTGKESPVETLRRWEERGLTDEAVGVYGTSQEFLDRCLATGFIPSQIGPGTAIEKKSEYLENLGLNNGEHIYFSYPFIDKIRALRPDFADQMAQRYPHLSPEEFSEELAPKEKRQGARYYAQMSAFSHYFSQATGIPTPDDEAILGLAYDMIPEKFSQTLDELHRLGLYRNFDPDSISPEVKKKMKQIRSKIDKAKLLPVLDATLDRRGVLLFYNEHVLEHAVGGWEAEDEMVIVTEDPLPIKAIDGIEQLTLESVTRDGFRGMTRKEARHAAEDKKFREALQWTQGEIQGESFLVTYLGIPFVGFTNQQGSGRDLIGNVCGREVTIHITNAPDKIFYADDVDITISRADAKYSDSTTSVQALRPQGNEIQVVRYNRDPDDSKQRGIQYEFYNLEHGGMRVVSPELIFQGMENTLLSMQSAANVDLRLEFENREGNVNILWEGKLIISAYLGDEKQLRNMRGFMEEDGNFVFYTPKAEKVTIDVAGNISVDQSLVKEA